MSKQKQGTAAISFVAFLFLYISDYLFVEFIIFLKCVSAQIPDLLATEQTMIMVSQDGKSIYAAFTAGKAGQMKIKRDIFEIFEHDESFKYIMKRLLEASMEESFNSVVITEAGTGYPIIYVNSAFCELTGYGPHEVMGKSPAMLQGPNTDQAVLERLNNDISEGRLFHGQAINYRKDGTEFMMEWKIVPIRNEKDEITHYLAIQRDVSAQ